MEKGTVKWFQSEKGFGFLTNDDGSGDVFVSAKGLADPNTPLTEGQRVTFDTVKGPKGLIAVHVKTI